MKRTAIATVVASLIIGFSAQVLAVDEPENVIKYRQAVMKAIGGHTAAIVGVLTGEVSFMSHIAAHARSINEMSKFIPGIFPGGSGQDAYPNTRALPTIWNDWAKFEAAAKAVQAESAKLAEVAQGSDLRAIGAQVQNLAKACGSCHKSFRAKRK